MSIGQNLTVSQAECAAHLTSQLRYSPSSYKIQLTHITFGGSMLYFLMCIREGKQAANTNTPEPKSRHQIQQYTDALSCIELGFLSQRWLIFF